MNTSLRLHWLEAQQSQSVFLLLLTSSLPFDLQVYVSPTGTSPVCIVIAATTAVAMVEAALVAAAVAGSGEERHMTLAAGQTTLECAAAACRGPRG